MRRAARLLRLLALPLVLVSATACRTDGLAFRADEPVAIDLPTPRSTSTLPMLVSWRTTTAIADAHRSSPHRPLFAVFVDQQPMPVGQTIAWIARDDTGCRPPACPDASYLHQHGVYLTSTTRVRISAILSTTRGRKTSNGEHELTIVLLDDHGRRATEAALTRTFFVRGAAS
jgi:hypothetical protein